MIVETDFEMPDGAATLINFRDAGRQPHRRLDWEIGKGSTHPDAQRGRRHSCQDIVTRRGPRKFEKRKSVTVVGSSLRATAMPAALGLTDGQSGPEPCEREYLLVRHACAAVTAALVNAP